MYDIKLCKWRKAPALKQARINHSGCALGDNIYVFCGYKDYEYSNDIEVLNARDFVLKI